LILLIGEGFYIGEIGRNKKALSFRIMILKYHDRFAACKTTPAALTVGFRGYRTRANRKDC
jgi:hypothetical protein